MSTTQEVATKQANGAISAPQAGQPSYAELLARVQQLEAQQPKAGELVIRINDGPAKDKAGNPLKDEKGEVVMGKGTVAVYGLGRFPVSLYAEQWERLLSPATVTRILETCKDKRASRKPRQ